MFTWLFMKHHYDIYKYLTKVSVNNTDVPRNVHNIQMYHKTYANMLFNIWNKDVQILKRTSAYLQVATW